MTTPKESLYLDVLDKTNPKSAGKPQDENLNEKAKLVNNEEELSPEEVEKLRIGALVVSWLSVLILSGLGITTLVVGILEESSASFAFALDAVLDCLTSAVVIWRYMGNANTVYSEKKERIACLVLGILFILSAISIIVKSITALVHYMLPSKNVIVWHLAVVNAVSCLGLAISKFFLGKKLKSKSLITDALNSTVGFVLGVSILITDLVYRDDTKVWVVDPVIGLLCALFLSIYGIRLVIQTLQADNIRTICCKHT